MATQTHTHPKPNDTIRAEQAKAEVSGSRKFGESGSKPNPWQDERDRLDQERHQKKPGPGKPTGKTGEPGRARNELDKNSKVPTMQPG
jgi:hypothetical protein